jgi:hypothetical protein
VSATVEACLHRNTLGALPSEMYAYALFYVGVGKTVIFIEFRAKLFVQLFAIASSSTSRYYSYAVTVPVQKNPDRKARCSTEALVRD